MKFLKNKDKFYTEVAKLFLETMSTENKRILAIGMIPKK